MRNALIFIFAILVGLIGSTIQAGELINYQGRLSDSDGNPVADDTYQLTFSLYDDSTGGFLQWSEEHPSVQTNNGLFNLILGSVFDLDASIFETEPLYLEIQVGIEVISPRTRLTSAPSAIRAKNMSGGDIETGEGFLRLKSSEGATAVSIRSEEKAGPAYLTMYNPDVEFADQPLVEMSSRSDGGSIEFFPAGDVPNDPAIRMGFEPTPFAGGKLEFFDPGSGWPDNPMMVMGTEPSPFHEASFRMYNPVPVPSPKLVELTVNDATGEWGSYFNMFLMEPPDEKQVLSMSAAPSTGASVKMFNPQMEPPARVMEMSVNESAGEWGSYFSMYSIDPGDDEREIFEISNTASTGASIKLFNPQPEPPAVYFDLNASPTAGASMNIYDDIGKVMGIEPSPFNSGYSIKMFNPQPEPPAVVAEITSSYNAKGGSGQVGVYDDANHLYSVLAPAKLALSYASGEILGPPVFMEASASEAKVGIGTYFPSEELHVVGDICYTGSIGACSDRRYKKDIQTIGDAAETLLKLRGVSYSWRQDEYPEMKFDDQTHLGFVAQEIKDLVPGVVLVDDNGNMSVDYGRITPLLVEAVKEQQGQIKELNAQIADLREALQKLQVMNR